MIRLSNHQFLQLKFIGCLLFIIGILFSKAILSLTTAYFIVIIILTGEYKKWNIELVKKNKLFPLLLYITWSCLSLFWSQDVGSGIKALVSNLNFYFVPPLLLLTIPLTENQNKYLLQFFAVLVVLITLVNFSVFQYNKAFVDIRNLSLFISHIRFSICVIIASVIITYSAFKVRRNSIRLFLYLIVIWLLYYTYYSQVLSGVLGLVAVIIALLGIWFNKAETNRMRLLILFFFTCVGLLFGIITFSLFHVDTTKLNFQNLPKYTKQGNVYTHEINSLDLENGYPLNCYLSVNEMDSTWLTRSNVTPDNLNNQGFSTRIVLIRYLTSKGLPKDAEGVNKLSEQDIKYIEAGVPSVLHLNQGMFARYYSLKDELSQNDNPNGHSLLQRIEYWKTALYMIKKHFLFGVGIGDYDKSYQNAYNELKSPLTIENRLGAHNQFLNVFVNFGFIGFILFIWMLYKAGLSFLKQNKSIAFIIFIVLLVSFLVEDTLGTLTGMSLFSFFYGLNLQINDTIVDN